ncbi:hypothetical protein F4X10_14200 [Candidatus Poribacteria bacterium]|nr:hypothetical protein [Candidatus Poribacteria bacterium]
MSHTSGIILIIVEFICGVCVCLIPIGFFIYFNLTVWQTTDPMLPTIERLNQTFRETFWENIFTLVLMIAVRKFMSSAIKYSRETESD